MGNSRCDFIAVKEAEVIKVQAKTVASRYYKETTYTLGVLTTTRNGEQQPYTPEEVDEFFVIGNSKAWVIPNNLVFPSTTVMLESTQAGYSPRHGWDTKSWRVTL